MENCQCVIGAFFLFLVILLCFFLLVKIGVSGCFFSGSFFSWLRLAKIRYFFSSSDMFCCCDDSNCKNTSNF